MKRIGFLIIFTFFSLQCLAESAPAGNAPSPSSETSNAPTSETASDPSGAPATTHLSSGPSAPATAPTAGPVVINAGATPEEAGKAKSAPCAACHNVDGNSLVGMYPKIAGLDEAYIIQSLQEYKKGPKGLRNNPIMMGMAAPLSDQDISDLAKYFSAQKRTPGGARKDLLELGQKIYRGGNAETGVPACIACHGPKGAGNPLANFPNLSGQNPEYVVAALKEYQSGERQSDVNEMMRVTAKRLTPQEMEAVASYVSGLQ